MRDNEMKVTLYTVDPSQISDLKRLTQYDRWAQNSISKAKELIKQAESYRLKLYERCRELELMDSHTKITLEREQHWKGNIIYWLRKTTVYSDGTECTQETTKYEGRQRHEAIEAFDNLKKQYPMFEYVLNIAKAPYER